ncbi:hypothetical protein [Phaeodactylibacter luteus]|uniref:DUF3784 domain-containing protein n=1 Tax=Phaeodactylibacter luteus TaxID=1564516 RepID=A0A5C6RFM4_9BACT|nr:hypothetical protein [Phaeodactylibacter luteus]TXB56028.1 hypothetical protein FRY97_21860 [Phaeodactylibacter luteus]
MEITQAIIAGMFTILGVWFKHYLENRGKEEGRPPKKYVSPKEQMKKGLKRVLLAFFFMIIISASANPQDKSTGMAIFAMLSFVILFYGIWLILKGFLRMIFS